MNYRPEFPEEFEQFGELVTELLKFAEMWFGPTGFASVVYGLIVLESGIDQTDHLFHLVALIIVISIIAHSSTDVVVAKKLEERMR